MSTIPTSNPIQSESPKDLAFNAGKIDEFVNSPEEAFSDRFGLARLTLTGIQAEADNVILSLGYLPVDSFEAGATITVRNQALHYLADGNYYRWNGSLPKVVPASSTPASTGGISANAWVNVSDATLRGDLATGGKASLVGYQNPSSLINDTVKGALDKINTVLIYAKDFGVNANGGDDTDALFNLGQFISNATTPLHVIFPKGVSRVGSQQFAGVAGLGYSYRPSYFTRAWGDASDMGWFSIHRTDNNIVLDMSGWTLKMNDGMKIGSYDPVTGSSLSPSLPFYNYDYQASQGYLIKIFQAPNIIMINGVTDGNLANTVWGGNFGDTGYQAPAYNIWFNQSSGVQVYDHTSKNSPLDGFYIGETGDAFQPTTLTQIKGSYFKDCVLQDCGRNIISYTGGANAVFENCNVWRAGNNATGITGHGSGPASCLDVESEGGVIQNLTFSRCKFMVGGDAAVIGGFAQPNDVTNVKFSKCVMHCETGAQAFVNYARNCTLEDCTIYGGTSLNTGTKQAPTKIIRCKFYNRVDGRYITNFAMSGFTDLMEDCEIYYEIPTSPIADFAIFNVGGYQPLSGGYGTRAIVKNLRIFLSGNSNNVTHLDMGGFSYFRGITCHIEAGGVTGSKPLAVYMRDSTAGFEGLTVSGSSLITYGGTMVNQPSTGIYYDTAVPTRVGGVLQPGWDNSFSLGNISNSFRQVYANLGVMTRSPNGTQYRVRVNDAGTVYAVADNT